MAELPSRLPAGEAAMAAALRGLQRANGAFAAGGGWAPLAAGAWAAWALDLAGEDRRARAFHLWAGELLRRAAAQAAAGAAGPARGEAAPSWPLAAAGAAGLWLWTLGRHLEMRGLAAVPGRLTRPARAAIDALLALAEALEVSGAGRPSGAATEEERARQAAALAAVHAGLNAMDRWFAIPPLTGRLVTLWQAVERAVEAAAASALPAAARTALLAAGVPFDVVDPRGAPYLRLLERQAGEPLRERRDAPGLALEAWALLCLGRAREAELRWQRLGEIELRGDDGLAALALALIGQRARAGARCCP
ncbi:MAG: hypothetical protein QJR08_07050 [Bacillota bacterium]|nr:hypothetical protein [Bacillota bacterium]